MTRKSEKAYLEARKLYRNAERSSRVVYDGDTPNSRFERAAPDYREALKILEAVHNQWSDDHYKLAFDICTITASFLLTSMIMMLQPIA